MSYGFFQQKEEKERKEKKDGKLHLQSKDTSFLSNNKVLGIDLNFFSITFLSTGGKVHCALLVMIFFPVIV